jgi:HEPN/Toprim N-terminal domain 1
LGSMIHLAVGRLEVDWGKNNGFADHSALFQKGDLTNVPYYYVAPEEQTYIDEFGERRFELVAELNPGMSKPLLMVADRIEMLGHTLDMCRHEFHFFAVFNEFDEKLFSFDHLAAALAAIDVEKISADYGEMGEDFGKFFKRQIFDRLSLAGIVPDPSYVRQYAGEAMENMSVHTILRLLALNPKASKLPVNWQFADVMEGGWAHKDSFVRDLDVAKRFLIVTEGSSDAKILERAFALRRPHVADFFKFVDMEEGYPFTGTGNVFRFVQGLIGIGIQNKVVVVYDNDAEGLLNYEKTVALNLPENIKVIRLPDDDAFRKVSTIGPTGTHLADINGKAASIECYLDLPPSALVRWTSFNAKLGCYQGELEGKEFVTKAFFRQSNEQGAYDYSKIDRVLRCLEGACVGISAAQVWKDWDQTSRE